MNRHKNFAGGMGSRARLDEVTEAEFSAKDAIQNSRVLTKNRFSISLGFMGYGSEETTSSDDSLLASDDIEAEIPGEATNSKPDLGLGCSEGLVSVDLTTENNFPSVEEQDPVNKKAWKLFMVNESIGSDRYVILSELQPSLANSGTINDMVVSLTGKLERGRFNLGDRLTVMPNRISANVIRIWSDKAEILEASRGDHVGISLNGVDIDLLADACVLSDKEDGSLNFPVDTVFQNLMNYLGPETIDGYPEDLRDAILSYKRALDEKCEEVAQLEKEWRSKKLQAESKLQELLLVVSAVKTRGAVPLLIKKPCTGDTDSVGSYFMSQVGHPGIKDPFGPDVLFWVPRDVQKTINHIGTILMNHSGLGIQYRDLSSDLGDYQLAFHEFLQERNCTVRENREDCLKLMWKKFSADEDLPLVLIDQLKERELLSGLGLMRFMQVTVFPQLPGYDLLPSDLSEANTIDELRLCKNEWKRALKCSAILRECFDKTSLMTADIPEVAMDTLDKLKKSAPLLAGRELKWPAENRVPMYISGFPVLSCPKLNGSNILFLMLVCEKFLGLKTWFYREEDLL